MNSTQQKPKQVISNPSSSTTTNKNNKQYFNNNDSTNSIETQLSTQLNTLNIDTFFQQKGDLCILNSGNIETSANKLLKLVQPNTKSNQYKTSNNKSSKNHPSVKQDNTNPPSIPKIVINDVSYKNLQLLMLLYTIILNLNNKQEANNSINKILYTLNLVECNSKCDKYDKFIEQYMDIMKNNSSSEPDKIFQLIIKYIHQPIIQNNDSLITMLSKPNYDDIINNNKELNEDVKNAYKQLFEIANKISNNNLNQAISDLKTKSFNTLQTKLKNLLSNNKKEEAIPTLEALLNNKELALCHSFITQLIAIFKDNNNNTQEDILTAYNKLISNIDNTEIKPLLLKLLAIKLYLNDYNKLHLLLNNYYEKDNVNNDNVNNDNNQQYNITDLLRCISLLRANGENADNIKEFATKILNFATQKEEVEEASVVNDQSSEVQEENVNNQKLHDIVINSISDASKVVDDSLLTKSIMDNLSKLISTTLNEMNEDIEISTVQKNISGYLSKIEFFISDTTRDEIDKLQNALEEFYSLDNYNDQTTALILDNILTLENNKQLLLTHRKKYIKNIIIKNDDDKSISDIIRNLLILHDIASNTSDEGESKETETYIFVIINETIKHYSNDKDNLKNFILNLRRKYFANNVIQDKKIKLLKDILGCIYEQLLAENLDHAEISTNNKHVINKDNDKKFYDTLTELEKHIINPDLTPLIVLYRDIYTGIIKSSYLIDNIPNIVTDLVFSNYSDALGKYTDNLPTNLPTNNLHQDLTNYKTDRDKLIKIYNDYSVLNNLDQSNQESQDLQQQLEKEFNTCQLNCEKSQKELEKYNSEAIQQIIFSLSQYKNTINTLKTYYPQESKFQELYDIIKNIIGYLNNNQNNISFAEFIEQLEKLIDMSDQTNLTQVKEIITQYKNLIKTNNAKENDAKENDAKENDATKKLLDDSEVVIFKKFKNHSNTLKVFEDVNKLAQLDFQGFTSCIDMLRQRIQDASTYNEYMEILKLLYKYNIIIKNDGKFQTQKDIIQYLYLYVTQQMINITFDDPNHSNFNTDQITQLHQEYNNSPINNIDDKTLKNLYTKLDIIIVSMYKLLDSNDTNKSLEAIINIYIQLPDKTEPQKIKPEEIEPEEIELKERSPEKIKREDLNTMKLEVLSPDEIKDYYNYYRQLITKNNIGNFINCIECECLKTIQNLTNNTHAIKTELLKYQRLLSELTNVGDIKDNEDLQNLAEKINHTITNIELYDEIKNPITDTSTIVDMNKYIEEKLTELTKSCLEIKPIAEYTKDLKLFQKISQLTNELTDDHSALSQKPVVDDINEQQNKITDPKINDMVNNYLSHNEKYKELTAKIDATLTKEEFERILTNPLLDQKEQDYLKEHILPKTFKLDPTNHKTKIEAIATYIQEISNTPTSYEEIEDKIESCKKLLKAIKSMNTDLKFVLSDMIKNLERIKRDMANILHALSNHIIILNKDNIYTEIGKDIINNIKSILPPKKSGNNDDNSDLKYLEYLNKLVEDYRNKIKTPASKTTSSGTTSSGTTTGTTINGNSTLTLGDIKKLCYNIQNNCSLNPNEEKEYQNTHKANMLNASLKLKKLSPEDRHRFYSYSIFDILHILKDINYYYDKNDVNCIYRLNMLLHCIVTDIFADQESIDTILNILITHFEQQSQPVIQQQQNNNHSGEVDHHVQLTELTNTLLKIYTNDLQITEELKNITPQTDIKEFLKKHCIPDFLKILIEQYLAAEKAEANKQQLDSMAQNSRQSIIAQS